MEEKLKNGGMLFCYFIVTKKLIMDNNKYLKFSASYYGNI